MRMVLTESAIKARTIWKAFDDPDGTVVVQLDPNFVSLNPKTPSDEGNGFAPIWLISNERAFRAIARQCRKAEQIILTQRDDWQASVIEETLRSSGITAPIRRVVLAELHDDVIRSGFDQNTPIDREAVSRTWRVKTADRIAGDPISKVIKKSLGVEWNPTLRGIQMLRKISDANHRDSNPGTTQPQPVIPPAGQATLLGALIRLSETNHPAVVAQQINDLMDHGLLSLASPASVDRLIAWCVENCGIKPMHANAKLMLLPMDAAVDLSTVQPVYQTVYTNIWSHAIRAFVPKFNVQPHRPPGAFESESSRIISRGDPMQNCMVLGELRDAGLIFGWSYTQLTDAGVLVDTIIKTAWPMLADAEFIDQAIYNVEYTKVQREDAIGAIKTATLMSRSTEIPESSTMCPACHGVLKAFLTQRRLRLICQDSTCSRVWPAQQDGVFVRPLVEHVAPRWCEKDGVVLHEIAIDYATQSTRQTCKECQRSSTY